MAGKPSTEFHSEVVSVTPKMAEKWLEGHENIREISWPNVAAMANDMRDGKWELTHQGICFDGEGNLLDGQHRLYAIIQANVTIRMLVTWNPKGSMRAPIDRGRGRTIGNITGLRTREVGACNTLRFLEAGCYVHTPQTLAEAEEIYERHQEAFKRLADVKHSNKLIAGLLGACIWALPINPEKVLEFAHKVTTGEMIAKGHPAYAYRSWRERNPRAQPWEVVMAALNCLRHYLTDAQLNSVYQGEMGYRAITGKRRAMRIPHTPKADVVPPGNWNPTRAEKLE